MSSAPRAAGRLCSLSSSCAASPVRLRRWLSASPCGPSLWMGGHHLPVRGRSILRCTGRARMVGAVRASAFRACASCIPCRHEHALPCVDAGARWLNEDKWHCVASRELRAAERAMLVPWRGLSDQPAGSYGSESGASGAHAPAPTVVQRFTAVGAGVPESGRQRPQWRHLPAPGGLGLLSRGPHPAVGAWTYA